MSSGSGGIFFIHYDEMNVCLNYLYMRSTLKAAKHNKRFSDFPHYLRPQEGKPLCLM